MSDDEFVIKLEGGIDRMERYPEMMAQVGRYLLRYEPKLAPMGRQWLWTTDDLDEALGFDSFASAHALYSTSIGTRPWDGKPDRPLSAYHVQVAKRGSFRD